MSLKRNVVFLELLWGLIGRCTQDLWRYTINENQIRLPCFLMHGYMKAVVVSPRIFGVKYITRQKGGRKGVSCFAWTNGSFFVCRYASQNNVGFILTLQVHAQMRGTCACYLLLAHVSQQTVVVSYSLEILTQITLENCQMITSVAQFQTPWCGFFK